MNKKVYQAVMSGKADHNIDFNDFVNLMQSLGFVLQRQRGSHMMFQHTSGAYMNVQKMGNKAKALQVQQLRNNIRRYGL